MDSTRVKMPRRIRAGTLSTAVAVDDDPSVLLLAANVRRVSALIVNNGPDTLYIGPASTVTAANGIPVASGGSFIDERSTSAWYGIAGAADSCDVRILEV